MNDTRQARRQAAFTLIELLIVIAIIAILAALLLPVGQKVLQNRTKAMAYSELNEISTAIEAYKARNGFYPPDNPTNTWINPLYFELEGTVLTNGTFVTLDGSGRILASDVLSVFGVSGFANSSTGGNGDNERTATTFLKDLKPMQIGELSGARPQVKLLVFSGGWGGPGGYVPVIGPSGSDLDPWQYNSSHPTNNPASYDLWVDIYLGGKTIRISNWSKKPETIPFP